MTDLATAEPAAPLSTTLDTTAEAGPAGGGAPRVLPEEDKAPSLRDTIVAEVKKESEEKTPDLADTDDDKAKGEEAAKEGKPQDEKEPPEAKEPKGPERGADGKFAAKQAEEPKAEEAPKPDADAKADKPAGHIEPPKTFLPDAKETWRNTPRAVQRDVENMVRQHEADITRYREGAERYESIRPYDEAARQSGRAGVHESLAEVAQLEDLMKANPLAALNQILLRAGPRKADGQPVSLYELATAIVNTGQDGYQRIVSQQAPQAQRQPDPEVAHLKAQLAQMQEQTLAATVIEPFRAANPRYDELQDDIAFFLQSGKVPNSLSPSERLAVAYDMAVRINPASHANDAAPQTDLEPARRADDPSAAAKSIKSAPGAVSTEMEPERGGSIRDLLAQELKRAKGSR